MGIYIVISVIVLIVIYVFFFQYNSFVKWTNKAKEAFSTMDIY